MTDDARESAIQHIHEARSYVLLSISAGSVDQAGADAGETRIATLIPEDNPLDAIAMGAMLDAVAVLCKVRTEAAFADVLVGGK